MIAKHRIDISTSECETHPHNVMIAKHRTSLDVSTVSDFAVSLKIIALHSPLHLWMFLNHQSQSPAFISRKDAHQLERNRE